VTFVNGQGRRTSLNGELHEDTGIALALRSVQNPTDQRQPRIVPLTTSDPTVGVVIACFDLQRMSLLMRAIESVCDQDYPNKLTVVVDYNEELYYRVVNAVPKNVSIMRNTRSRGAAGARNTAALVSDCALIAFLDDDACAKAAWLRSLVCAMDRPGVVGVGGRILPRWQKERPRWFPPEFGWVVGASIVGAGEGIFPVRNVWSGSMMVDREAFQKVDGFREDLSKVGGAARPEDTELCLRLSHVYGTSGQWLMVPSALVEHYVPAYRTTLRYVLTRCWAEGAGKAQLGAMAADRSRALVDEKIYLSKEIPRAFGAGVLQSLRLRKVDGLMRSGTILLGVTAAIFGAIVASVGAALARHGKGQPA
jgi:glucosyl-dolichyl phosphate glucuronosyltransferase